MKKIIVLAALAYAGYYFYQHGFSFSSGPGAFDAQGKPAIVLVVGPGCGDHCDKLRKTLRSRNLAFEEIDIAGPDGAPQKNKYGITNYPTTIVGNETVLGDNVMALTSVLAEKLGKQVLSRKEDRVMASHFDSSGRAQVVMYATTWCPYCKQLRQYFADNHIPYKEVDVEASEKNMEQYSAFEASGYPLTYVGYRRFNGVDGPQIASTLKELTKAGPRL